MKQVLKRPPEPKASPEPRIVSLIVHAFALGRAETWPCQRRTLTRSSGTASRAGFMKSIATSPVISAIVK